MTWTEVIQAWLFKEPGGLLRTRSVLALTLVVFTAVMWINEIEVHDAQLGLTVGVVTFYFTGRLKADLNNAAAIDTTSTSTKVPLPQ